MRRRKEEEKEEAEEERNKGREREMRGVEQKIRHQGSPPPGARRARRGGREEVVREWKGEKEGRTRTMMEPIAPMNGHERRQISGTCSRCRTHANILAHWSDILAHWRP